VQEKAVWSKKEKRREKFLGEVYNEWHHKRKFLERTLLSHTLASLTFLGEFPKKGSRLGARENRPSIVRFV
jgi:hypothetical protein